MNRDEIERFEADSYHREAVRMRLYDDDGKAAGLEIRLTFEYRDKLTVLLTE